MPLIHVTDDELRTCSARQLGQLILDRIAGIPPARRRHRGEERTKAYQRTAEEAWRSARTTERDMLRGTGLRGDAELLDPTTDD